MSGTLRILTVLMIGVILVPGRSQVASRTLSITWSPAGVATYRNSSNPLRTNLGDTLVLQCINQPSNLFIQFEEVQYDTCNATAGSGEYRYGGFCLGNDELQLTIHVNPINIVSFQNNTTYYLTSYYNGILEDIQNESINTGEECEAGLKMVFVIGEINPREPPDIPVTSASMTTSSSPTDELDNSFKLEATPLLIGISAGVPLVILLLATVSVITIILGVKKCRKSNQGTKFDNTSQIEQIYDYPAEVNLPQVSSINLQQNKSYGEVDKEIGVSRNKAYGKVESPVIKDNLYGAYSKPTPGADIRESQYYEEIDKPSFIAVGKK